MANFYAKEDSDCGCIHNQYLWSGQGVLKLITVTDTFRSLGSDEIKNMKRVRAYMWIVHWANGFNDRMGTLFEV